MNAREKNREGERNGKQWQVEQGKRKRKSGWKRKKQCRDISFLSFYSASMPTILAVFPKVWLWTHCWQQCSVSLFLHLSLSAHLYICLTLVCVLSFFLSLPFATIEILPHHQTVSVRPLPSVWLTAPSTCQWATQLEAGLSLIFCYEHHDSFIHSVFNSYPSAVTAYFVFGVTLLVRDHKH